MKFEQIDYKKLVEDLGTDPLPIESYVSAEAYESEMNNIFKKAWLKVALENEIPNVGDYKVKRLEFASTSVILVRGKDNKIRAFHNMCSHRGNKVIPDNNYETFGGNRAAVMTCRFHGWVFDAQGQLVDVPRVDQFPACFQQAENGLTPIHCDVWAGFVFINLDRSPQTLSDYLGDASGHLEGFPFDKLSQCFSYHTILNTNWKIGMDAFSEAYHVATLHAGSLSNVEKCTVGGTRFYGPHKSISTFFDLQPVHPPVAEAANRRATSNLASIHHQGRLDLPERVNPERKANFAFEMLSCFPNILIHVAQDTWFTHQFWPMSQGQTLWEGRFYCPPNRRNSDFFAAEYAHIVSRAAWLEDTGTMENTYEAMKSGAKDKQWLMEDEILIRHQLAVIKQLAG